jgi:beta-glucosidase
MYGIQAPSGRLPYTVAKNESDYGELLHPVRADNASNYYTSANFTEGVYIDYRRFDALNITPRYEFGFGLTYTTFEYSNLTVKLACGADVGPLPPPSEILPGGATSLWDVIATASVEVLNVGNVSAPEVPQLYLERPDAAGRQLRGFEKVPLDPQEKTTVIFPLTRRDLSTWDVVQQQWVLQKGDYRVDVGASSRDIRATGMLSIE